MPRYHESDIEAHKIMHVRESVKQNPLYSSSTPTMGFFRFRSDELRLGLGPVPLVA